MQSFRIIPLLLAAMIVPASFAGERILAENGRTEYRIVCQKNAGDIEKFAARELSEHLRLATGAEFPISCERGEHNIFVGADSPGQLHGFSGDEWCIRTRNGDLFLFGGGMHGTLYAVYEYLENQLGFRWFSPFGDIRIPRLSRLSQKDLELRGKYPFQVRGLQTFFYREREPAALYHYRNRQNILLYEVLPGIRNAVVEYKPNVESLSTFLHPGTVTAPEDRKMWEKIKNRFGREKGKWNAGKNYFQNHPEYFPMNREGKRYPFGQLCFSNPDLKKELTKNIYAYLEEQIRLTGTKKAVLTLDHNDIVYEEICCCENCRALARKYGTNAAAYWIFVREFCRDLQKKYPEMTVKATAYLTFITPPASSFGPMPDNLMIVFAPIYQNFAAPLEGSSANRPFLNDLIQWRKLCRTVWLWSYPLPYPEEKDHYLFLPPIANIGRTVSDIRTIRRLDVSPYFEHDSGYGSGTVNFGFFGLQSYLMLKLFQNPDASPEPILREYAEFFYGPASETFLEYLHDVERCNQQLGNSGKRFCMGNVRFDYLTPENLERWNHMFEKMETLTRDAPKYRTRIRVLRLNFDAGRITVLSSCRPWKEIAPMADRLTRELADLNRGKVISFDMNLLKKWLTSIQTKDKNMHLEQKK